MNPKITELSQTSLKKDMPVINPGDTVKVTVRIKEGNKERNQNFEGVIIKIKGSSINKTFTVRKVFQGVGVERVFFLHSPKIEQIKILRSGNVRRSKLYYLRERSGKATRLKEKITVIKTEAGSKELPKEQIPEEGKLVEAVEVIS